MIFEMHETGTDVNFLIFEDNMQSWECLEMLHNAFPALRENSKCVIVCWSRYENGIQLARQ
jgi:hypothetical protein